MDKSLGIDPIYGTIFGILLVEGFVVTTLDTAVRLNRYLLEEVWQVIFKNVPAIMKSYLFNAFLCVFLMYILAYTNAFAAIWPIFGSANQLLASLALIAVVCLAGEKKEDNVVYRVAGDLHDGHHPLFAGFPAHYQIYSQEQCCFVAGGYPADHFGHRCYHSGLQKMAGTEK